MLSSSAQDVLAVAHQRGNRLREESAAQRFRRPSRSRAALAASLRRVADHLDRAPLAPHTAR